MGELTETERAILDLEAKTYRRGAAKDERIRADFAMTPPAYYQMLSALIDQPAALAYAPMVVARLRRLRSARR